MKNSELEIAVCQMTSVDEVDANAKAIHGLLDQLEKEQKKPQMIFLPETSLYLRIVEGGQFPVLQTEDEIFRKLSERCMKNQWTLHLGSVPLRGEQDEKATNTVVILDANGFLHTPYSKIHLFDVDVQGHKPQRESDDFLAGDQAGIYQHEDWKIGQAICYDLRFSELFVHYAKKEVDAITVPAAFLTKTGEAHWEVLLRARAIETQSYLIAAAQGGEHTGVHGGRRKTFGHSMVVDPWGKVLGVASQDQPIVRATLMKEKISRVRQQIPMKDHRRWTESGTID